MAKDFEIYNKDLICMRLRDAYQRTINAGITQQEVLKRINKRGLKMKQPALSKMMNQGEGMSNLEHILIVAQALHINLNSLLSDDTERDVEFTESYSPAENLIQEADNPWLMPYMNTYYLYFLPTKKKEQNILQATIEFKPLEENGTVEAVMSLPTGKKMKNGQPITKNYRGNLVYSVRQHALYCRLMSEKEGEISYLCACPPLILNEKCKCGLAMALTMSAGTHRRPTAHRMIFSICPLKDKQLNLFRSELYMNQSEILISKKKAEEVLKIAEMDALSKEMLAECGENGELIKFCGKKPELYFKFKESAITDAELNQDTSWKILSAIRKAAYSEKYNKISPKASERIFEYLNSIHFFDDV